ncbi:hypothetical protein B9N57_06865 [Finegoldia magna]|uniref:restriction endonuclease subunit S n=1 Tax=Finegoldia magna TaxID=1260 RepID=UPI000B91BA97|nr:restriction endonuclease subunit S [Finegoldia magna]OXZ30114.1 hypothetical protein B9N57_06865 [Finegoldia magna]
MTPQELKNSILQRAIEGKLVEQRKEEERVNLSLLNKITKKKVNSDNLFNIPKSWEWVNLVDICDLIGGYAFKSSKYLENGVRVIRISDFNENGLLDRDKKFYKEESFLSKYLINSNDILMCMTGGTVGKTVFLGEIKDKLYLNQRVAAIRIKNKSIIDNNYLNYVIESKHIKNIINTKKNSTNDNISMKLIQQFQIPIPPLAEQKRIVEKIEELTPLVDSYEKNWKKLEKLNKKFPEDMKKSLLQEAIKGKLVEQRKEEGTGAELFEKIQKEKKKLVGEGKLKKQKALDEIKEEEIPFDIPENWKWVRLGEISDYNNVKTKIKPNEITPDTWTLDLEDIEKDTGFILKRKFARDKIIKGERTIFHRDQILYSKLRPYLKKILVALDSGVCSSELVPFSCFSDINSEFLVYLLKSPYIDRTINLATYGVKMPRVGTETMIHLLLPLPPLAEQKRIVEKLDEMLPYCDELLKII